jgi:hypothetical protein
MPQWTVDAPTRLAFDDVTALRVRAFSGSVAILATDARADNAPGGSAPGGTARTETAPAENAGPRDEAQTKGEAR